MYLQMFPSYKRIYYKMSDYYNAGENFNMQTVQTTLFIVSDFTGVI